MKGNFGMFGAIAAFAVVAGTSSVAFAQTGTGCEDEGEVFVDADVDCIMTLDVGTGIIDCGSLNYQDTSAGCASTATLSVSVDTNATAYTLTILDKHAPKYMAGGNECGDGLANSVTVYNKWDGRSAVDADTSTGNFCIRLTSDRDGGAAGKEVFNLTASAIFGLTAADVAGPYKGSARVIAALK